MRHALKSIACPRSSSASVVDGKLILSFPHAKTPVVWQMDLDNAKASALEVREGREAGTFTLVLKTPKGETVDIAPFENRKQAVDGLMAAAAALENAHGQIRPASASGSVTSMKPRSSGKWIGIIAGLVVLFLLLGVWGSLRTSAPGGGIGMTGTAGPAAEGPEAAAEPGVAQSADQFLQGR